MKNKLHNFIENILSFYATFLDSPIRQIITHIKKI